jgi:hypothetical protein
LTFKDLKKRVTLEATQQQSRLFKRLQNKPFWIWNIAEHKQEDVKTNGNCCFNHIIGLPQKDGNDKPLYDYEQIIFDSLVTQNYNKHLWIKKATGLGISEFMLRFMAWLCLKDNALSGSQMCIVTGPRIDLGIDFLKKLSIDAAQNRQKACKLIRQEIEGKISLTNLWTEESFAKVMDLLCNEDIQTQIFKGKNERGRLNHFVNTIDRQQMYSNFWQPVLTLRKEG